MAKKPETGTAQQSGAHGKALEDDLRELYARYREGQSPEHMKDLADKLAKAYREQNQSAASPKSKKVQAAE